MSKLPWLKVVGFSILLAGIHLLGHYIGGMILNLSASDSVTFVTGVVIGGTILLFWLFNKAKVWKIEG